MLFVIRKKREAPSDLSHDLVGRLMQRLDDLQRALGRRIDNNASIDHEQDAQRCSARRSTLRLAGEMENRDVDRRRLACSRRQVDEIRPTAHLHNPLRKPRLPGERFVTMHRREEGGKIFRDERSHDGAPSSSGKHKPNPRKRPAPSVSGPRIGRGKVNTRWQIGFSR